MDAARAALSKRRAGHQGALGSRPRRAARGSGCAGAPGTSRGARERDEEGAGARPGRGTRRGSRRPVCEQLQNEASSLPGILAATPWKVALCQGGTGASALPRVQVGGPGPRRGWGECVCLLTQEGAPSPLPATRDEMLGMPAAQHASWAPSVWLSLGAGHEGGGGFLLFRKMVRSV